MILKGLCQERITGEDGHCLSKDFMTGWFSPSVIIIVDRRKIIMNQGIGMNHLKGAGKGKNPVSFSPRHLKGGHA